MGFQMCFSCCFNPLFFRFIPWLLGRGWNPRRLPASFGPWRRATGGEAAVWGGAWPRSWLWKVRRRTWNLLSLVIWRRFGEALVWSSGFSWCFICIFFILHRLSLFWPGRFDLVCFWSGYGAIAPEPFVLSWAEATFYGLLLRCNFTNKKCLVLWAAKSQRRWRIFRFWM